MRLDHLGFFWDVGCGEGYRDGCCHNVKKDFLSFLLVLPFSI